jgi:hypothetical protein
MKAQRMQKQPYEIVKVPFDKDGWYIRDEEDCATYYMGKGKDGRECAERSIGQWIRAYERGIKVGTKRGKRIKKKA